MRQQHHSISRLGALVGIFVCLLAAQTASSIDVSVSATVPGEPPEEPPTKVRFIGRAYPNSDVTVRQNGTTLAVVPAGPTAAFDVEIEIAPGSYTFTLFAEDVYGVVGRSFQISLVLAEGVTTTISGIFLAPTISLNNSTFQPGQTITVLGQTVPSSDVTVTVNSHNQIVEHITAGSDGLWSKQFVAGSGDLHVGDHTTKAKAVAPDSGISDTSNTLAFSIGTSACGAGPGDLNCDGRVDLIDFSILLYYWNQSNPSLDRADINDDGVVGIVDFSIMLYYWTG